MSRSAEKDAALVDLRERLTWASRNLGETQSKYMSGIDGHTRLGGKIEGVKLALSYVEDALRVTPPAKGDPQ